MKKDIRMLNKHLREEGISNLSFATNNKINTDPDGMWTGVCTEDCFEKPVQDVDDL